MDLTENFGFNLSEKLTNLEISSEQILLAYLKRISEINSTISAIISLEETEKLLINCREIDQLRQKGESIHPCAGLPIAIKDLENTRGLLTTQGSQIYSDYVPKADSPMVANIRKAGLVIIGKTNTPEFGVGGQTFNSLFKTTVNPFDLNLTAGGSSGGAAAAVQSRLVPFADGSDMMGSLRTPSSFCRTYSFRPTPGLIPSIPDYKEDLPQISTNGVIARHPIDLAILLEILSGRTKNFLATRTSNPQMLKDVTIGIPLDYLSKIIFEEGITKLFKNFISDLRHVGVKIVELNFNFEQNLIWDSWTTFRSKIISLSLKDEYALHRELLKDSIVWEIERGLKLTDAHLTQAKAMRSLVSEQLYNIFSEIDFLVLPSAQVFPFSKNKPYPYRINGNRMDTYHRWLEITIPASLLGLPVASIPVTLEQEQPLLGVQFIAKSHQDAKLLEATLQMHYAIN